MAHAIFAAGVVIQGLFALQGIQNVAIVNDEGIGQMYVVLKLWPLSLIREMTLNLTSYD